VRVTQTGWLGVLLLLALVLGGGLRFAWPAGHSALPCESSQVRWVDAGTSLVATCEPGGSAGVQPAGPALALGVKLDLNRASEEELRLVPGVGAKLARAIVEARSARGGFKAWDEVDEVPGVGPVKLARLKEATDLRP
jgi:competence protein ComEA